MNNNTNGICESAYETAAELYEGTINWLQYTYSFYRFFTERDIVWTLQLHLVQEIERRHLHLKVFDNHKMPNQTLVDLAIIEEFTGSMLLVSELKYADHARTDISPGKLRPSKVFWDSERNHGVVQDVKRIKRLIELGLSEAGYVTFIDEGGHHGWHEEPSNCIWSDWGKSPYSDNTTTTLLLKCQGK